MKCERCGNFPLLRSTGVDALMFAWEQVLNALAFAMPACLTGTGIAAVEGECAKGSLVLIVVEASHM
jgi:hypothetical protein